MHFILLTHARETLKKTNTGQLVQQCLPNTQTIIWQRTEPDKKLLNLIDAGNIALVYPIIETSFGCSINKFEHFILIDSTWQEARKIYNKSPYLHDLPHIQITTKHVSKYNLRRNQVSGGLCTVECAIELLRIKACDDAANELNRLFSEFIVRGV